MATSSKSSDFKLAAGLVALALLCQLTLLSVRRTASVVSGDEGTFLAMAESLALDGDLVFGAADLDRVEAASEKGRKALILQEFGEETAYSKPVAYALLAAPWYRLAGPSGLVALNVVALALALLLAWGALARFGAPNPAATVATFAGAGVLMSYAAWMMSDSLQASLTLAGLALGLAGARDREPADTHWIEQLDAQAVEEPGGQPGGQSFIARFAGRFASRFENFWTGIFDRPWAPYMGVALLGVVVSMRLPNLAIAGAPVLAWLFRGRLRRSAMLAGVVVLVAGAGSLCNLELAGSAVPYKSVRATFNPQSGYPVGARAEEAKEQFSETVALTTLRMGIRPVWEPEASLYSTAYFWIGRHTGLLWYFPAALLLVLAGLRRPDAVGWAILLSAGALAIFYLVWMPRNYFGGATFLGNRYFLTGYAALLFLPRRGISRRALGVAWLIALVVFVSALVSIVRTRDRDASSQNHAYAGIFRLLPYETTARAIGGRRDVYWTDEFFRFVDPYAVVNPTGFSLRAGDRPAEVLHANRRPAGVVRFLVRADSPAGEIVYRGQGTEKIFELQPTETGVWGLVEIELQPSRRRHKYWWKPVERLHSRIHRFSLRSTGGENRSAQGASAELHYLGSMRLVPKFFRGVTMSVDLPKSARAGKSSLVPIRVRNTGYRFWSSKEAVPTRLGYRIYSLPRREGERPVSGRLQDFEGRVPRGSELDAELRVRWPKKPGRYELVVDLNLGGAIWYGAWNQEPLARGVVRVRPAESETASGDEEGL
ncbi:MAG: hypothetical protein IH936_11215 [Acidobacteria bacterium]|nr:hypothetical protein [Acidobacteriota bacterium]